MVEGKQEALLICPIQELVSCFLTMEPVTGASNCADIPHAVSTDPTFTDLISELIGVQANEFAELSAV